MCATKKTLLCIQVYGVLITESLARLSKKETPLCTVCLQDASSCHIPADTPCGVHAANSNSTNRRPRQSVIKTPPLFFFFLSLLFFFFFFLNFSVGGDSAVKHEPYIGMNTDASGNYAGSFTISVRGGDGSLDALHPQSPGAHWITNVWVEDQDGNVVCQHTFADEAAEAGEGEVVDVEEPTYTCNYEITE